MQSRRLRPGDLLDDYCPRERRLTDHAVVALIDDQIKRTRCLTCDEEHEYKQAKVPARRRKRDDQVAGAPDAGASAPRPALTPTGREPAAADEADLPSDEIDVEEVETVLAGSDNGGEPGVDGTEEGENERRVHRRLIRAVLPRVEGQPPQARPIPEFTIRNTAAPNTAPRRKSGPWQGRPQGESDWQPRTNGQGRPGGWSGQPSSNGPRAKQPPYRQASPHPAARNTENGRRAAGSRRGKRRHR